MTSFTSEVDQYFLKSADFAKPILKRWRKIIHDTCPEVVEVMKWGIPHFDYKGEMMCIIASHKNHCSFSFWKAELLDHPLLKENSKLKATERYLGKVTSLADLPPDKELIKLIKQAMSLNEKGIKMVKAKPKKQAVTEVPDDISSFLDADLKAKKIFEEKSASFRKEYIVWIASAKTEPTRQARIKQSLEWIAEGKSRFWQYKK